ncbi:MAG: PDZ domain-containing protein [Lachnospiraceae bacterium]|nr:PDZ domain-containing protein [Lachnospiraceae bacterium]
MRKRIVSMAAVAVMVLSLTGCTAPWADKDNKKGGNAIRIDTGNNATETDVFDSERVNEKVDEINRYVDSYFYFDKDIEKQEEAIYDGIMAGLDDPYSVYYTKEEYEQLLEEDSGEYVGVGAVVNQNEDKAVFVVRPIPDSPAEEAGMMAGDQIVEVDGTKIVDQDLMLVVDLIRGDKEGTTAHIKVYRESTKEYIDFEMVRRVVENYSVYHEMIDDIGYIEIQQFYENTPKEFKAAVEDVISKGAKGIIFDVRDNPGGLVTSVTDMCDYIMGDGVILTIEDKEGRTVNEYKSDEQQQVNIPMVVIANGNSASAAEIFTGALKDCGKATVVGTQTFGKGIVQSVIPLSDGTAIKLTIAKYFTPSGKDIHEIGIAPDYVVELPDNRDYAVGIEREDDTQLAKAIEVIQAQIN